MIKLNLGPKEFKFSTQTPRKCERNAQGCIPVHFHNRRRKKDETMSDSKMITEAPTAYRTKALPTATPSPRAVQVQATQANAVAEPSWASKRPDQMTKKEFQEWYATKHTGGNANALCKVGDNFKLVGKDEVLTCIRVEPKAKSCAFFAGADGIPRYLKIGRDLTKVQDS